MTAAQPPKRRTAAHTAGLLLALLALAWPAADREPGPGPNPWAAVTPGGADADSDADAADHSTRHAVRLMQQYQCVACHQLPGAGGQAGGAAPSLVDYGQRSYIVGRLPNSRPLLVRWIQNPPAVWPGATMPVLGVRAADAEVLAAHLQRAH